MLLYPHSVLFHSTFVSRSDSCVHVFRVDLMQLVEEAIDGCWIGHRARTAMGDNGIGSVYAPPNEDHGSTLTSPRKYVETVVNIGYRREVNLILLLMKFQINPFILLFCRDGH